LASLIKTTSVSLEVGRTGYVRVLNVVTNVQLGRDAPGYDDQKFQTLLKEIKPYLEHYDRMNVISRPAE